MDEVEGARSFGVTGSAYDSFMGRYSVPLAEVFADAVGVRHGQTAIDVGCGPGALTGVLVRRLGVDAVAACDPSPGFVSECAKRHAPVRVKVGRAEALPFESGRGDHAMAQLVLHFVSVPELAAREMMRIVRPGGSVSGCVWDFAGGMEMLRCFWDAALEIDPAAPDEAGTMRFGREGELAELFETAGMRNVDESTLRVASMYDSFEELWNGFLAGVGPAGTYCVSLSNEQQDRVRAAMSARLGSPTASFTLGAVARYAVGHVSTDDR